jgi:hypothetical protein
MRLIANKTGGEAVLHFVGSQSGVVIAGNNAVSNIATSNETVTTASINQIFYGSASGSSWTISRGANVVAVLEGTGHADYAGAGTSLKLDGGATLTVALSAGTGYLIVEMQKQSDIANNQYAVN